MKFGSQKLHRDVPLHRVLCPNPALLRGSRILQTKYRWLVVMLAHPDDSGGRGVKCEVQGHSPADRDRVARPAAWEQVMQAEAPACLALGLESRS